MNKRDTYSAFEKSYQKNKNAFDNDAVANSALDYLYSLGNQPKTQSFLENNGFPTAKEREYDKEFYGVQEENNRMRDLLKSKTNDIFNPKLPDKQDRLFLSGFWGDEKEEQNYQNEVKNANQAIADLQNAFRGSQFENQINGIANQTSRKINSTPQISNAILYNPNAKNEVKPIGTHDPSQKLVLTQYSNKQEPTMRFENGEYAARQQKLKGEEYNKKVAENAKMNDKSTWNTRRSSNIIKKNADAIKVAANKYGVNPAIIASCIYSEQMLNYNITDLAADKMYWRNPSVGIGQVSIETAKTIEKNTNIEKIKYLGEKEDWRGNSYTLKDAWDIPGYGVFLGTKEQAISKRLNNDEQCIEYVAAYLKLIQDLWCEEYPVISGDSAILATLYNIGAYGGEKGIHSSPTSNDFGDFAKTNYNHMRYLLGLE